MAFNLGDVKKNKIKVQTLEEQNNAHQPINIPSQNKKVKTTVNTKPFSSNSIIALNKEQNNTNNINLPIAKGLNNGIALPVLANKTKVATTLTKKPMPNADGYTDTGKKYGDYYYWDYSKRKDEKIYKKDGTYYIYNSKGKYEPIVDTNNMTTKELEAKQYKDAVKAGYKDKRDSGYKYLSVIQQLDLDTAGLTEAEKQDYADDIRRQKDKEHKEWKYKVDASGGASIQNAINKIEKHVVDPIKNFGDNYETGKLNNELALEYYKKMNGESNNADKLAKKVEIYNKYNQDLLTDPGLAGTAIQNLNTQVESLKNQGIAATALGSTGALIGTIIHPGGGTVAGAKIGAAAGYTLGSVPYTYKLEAGNQYKTLTDMGVPDDIAKKYSTATGAVNAAIESGENVVDLFTFGTASKATSAVSKEAVNNLVDDYGESQVRKWLTKKFGEQTANSIIKSAKVAGVSYIQNIGSEALEEMSQETTSIVGERLAANEAGIKRNATFKEDLDRVLQAGKDAAISTAFTAPITSLGGSVATNTINNIETNINNKNNNSQINENNANFNENAENNTISPVATKTLKNGIKEQTTAPVMTNNSALNEQITQMRLNEQQNIAKSQEKLTNKVNEIDTKVDKLSDTSDTFAQNNKTIEQNSSFSLDENAKRYEDLSKTNNIEYFIKDNGDVRVNLLDSNSNLINQFDLYNKREAIKELGEKIGSQIYESATPDNQIYRVGNDINNLGKETDYFMTHRPTESGITADNLLKQGDEISLPKDIYEHPEYYSNTGEQYLNETMQTLNQVKNNPNEDITIYRATTGNEFNSGDWVTLSKSYAEMHNQNQLDGKGRVIEMKVKPTDIQFAGDDLNEWGYFPKKISIPIANNNQEINLPQVKNKSLFLNNYSEKSADQILQNERHEIIHDETQLDDMIDEALNTQNNKALHLGIIDNNVISKIKDKIKNLPSNKQDYLQNTDYDLVINQSEIRHLKDDKTKLTNREIHDYVKKLPSLITDCDEVVYSKNEKDEGLRFKKQFEDGTYYSFDIVSNKKHTLTAKTIFMSKEDYGHKKRSISLPNNSSNELLDNTSETSRLSASLYKDDITISQKSQIAIPSKYNMQQKVKNDTKLPTKKKSNIPTKNTINANKESNVLKIEAHELSDELNKLKERKWVSTSTESDVLKGKVLIEDLDARKINYEIQSNKKTLDKANNKLNRLGYEESVKYIKQQINSDKVSLEDIVLAQRVLQEAAKQGDTGLVQDLVMDISIIGTDLGQKTQALSIIKKLTPEGQISMFSKIVKRAQLRGEKSFDDVTITPEMVQRVLDAYDKNGHYDQKDLDARIERFKQDIANQMKTTTTEKIDAWRYLSMLGNPKTHLRNMIGNIAMKQAVGAKNAIARTAETILPVKNRTKTWKPASYEILDYAEKTAKDMKDIITGENKFNEKTALTQEKKIFKNKLLQKLVDFNGNALEFEDWLFSKSAFEDTFSEYLTANGIKTMEDVKNNPKLIEKAKLYSVEQAEIATFRQYSKLAATMNRLESKSKLGKFFLQSTVPFKKTPINVAKTGVRYSPLGLIKSSTYDIYQMTQGNMEASQVIDDISQGLTGTSLMILGYALAKAGYLTGAGGDDKDDKYDSQLGDAGYSLKIGKNSYSLSWLSPVAMPLLVGANAYEQLEEEKNWDMNVVSESLSKTLDPLNEMSFMQSVTKVLSSYNSGTDKIKGIGESTVQNYAGQFFPTLLSQIAAVTDDKKRSTAVSSNSSYKFGEQTARSIMYKIPGLRQQLEPSTDIWGNEKEQEPNILVRSLETFILPYSKTKDISTDLDKELKRVYQETGENKVIPGIPYSYTKYKNNTYRLSAKEYTKYKKTYGQTANEELNTLIKQPAYKRASDERKVKMIKNVYDYARAIANEQYFDKVKDVDYSSDILNKVDASGKDAGIYFATKRYIEKD